METVQSPLRGHSPSFDPGALSQAFEANADQVQHFKDGAQSLSLHRPELGGSSEIRLTRSTDDQGVTKYTVYQILEQNGKKNPRGDGEGYFTWSYTDRPGRQNRLSVTATPYQEQSEIAKPRYTPDFSQNNHDMAGWGRHLSSEISKARTEGAVLRLQRAAYAAGTMALRN
jgi:hypothetical protein